MSTDPSTAAFARPDAAAAESQLLAAAQALDVAELIAALGQVEALLAGAPEGSEGSAAIERIADIAFVLHEREVERSLCDALDAAVREIGAADAVKRASLQRASEAAALLRELAHALNEILATAAVEPQPQPAAIVVEAPAPDTFQTAQDSRDAKAAEAAQEAEEDELAPPAGLFDADMPPDDAFAVTVAALADELPEAAGAAPADSQPEMPEPFAASETLTHSQSGNGADEQASDVFAPEEVIVSHSSAEEGLPEEVSDGQPLAAVNGDLGDEASQYTVPAEAFLNESAAAAPDCLETGESSDEQTTTSALADYDQGPPVAEPAETEPVDAAAFVAAHDEAPAQDEQSAVFSEVAPEPAASQPAIDPNEDPDELFEPVAELPPPSIETTPAAIATPSSDSEAAHASIPLAASPAEPAASVLATAETQLASASSLRLPSVAPVDEASPPSDPLAPIRALSEEELIALFS
jgi:hypothetical protein